jgi:hypothetical protein
MASKGCLTRFDDPIAQPSGRDLFTLKDAADYIHEAVESRAEPATVADSAS